MAKGYTDIKNDLFSGMARLKLTGAAFMVLNAIIRNTLCFHRDQHELSNSYLQFATGLSERSVIRAVYELEKLGIIKIVSKSCGSNPRKIRILTDRIVTLTETVILTDKNNSDNTDRNDSENTDNPVTQERKEKRKEESKKEKKEFLSDRRLTLEELAAISQAEEEDD